MTTRSCPYCAPVSTEKGTRKSGCSPRSVRHVSKGILEGKQRGSFANQPVELDDSKIDGQAVMGHGVKVTRSQ